MNDFYHVLIKNDGSIIHDVFATSHKDLICKYITPADDSKSYFRAMYSPKMDCRLDDLDNYQIIISENYIPDWFQGSLAEDITVKLREVIESMIVRGHKQLLLHDGAILVGTAVVQELKQSIVFAMYDHARIKSLDKNSEIHHVTDECIIEEMHDSTKIEELSGFAKVNTMFDYSKIIKMWGQSKVNIMNDNSRIAMLKGDANIISMHDEAQADRMKHMSKVDEMHGHSVIEEMWDWTIVEKMFDQSRINYMDEESKVCEMFGDSMIEVMCGNAIVEKLCENSLVRKLHDAAQILQKELE